MIRSFLFFAPDDLIEAALISANHGPNRSTTTIGVFTHDQRRHPKGQSSRLWLPLDALRMQGLEPTVSLRVVMDGEEELSSPSLDAALDRYRDKLTADLMLVFAGPIHFSNQPTIVSRVIAT
jgi:hypothetical protein